MEKISYDTFLYFINELNPANGLTKDTSDTRSPCSTSAVGFALTAYCIGESRGWMTYDDAYNLTLLTLKTFYEKLEHKNGFFYHFVNPGTGERIWNSEVSSIDTALFICGALVAGEYFKETPIQELANKLYDRIDWKWMTNESDFLCMGYKPETGFLPYYWDTFNEGILAYILAIGSSTHPVDKKLWTTWRRPKGKYKNFEFIFCSTGSLFVYQYPHLFVNFKNINDNGINYWDNSILATFANRQFCIDNKEKYKTYSEDCWGLTASLGPDGYKGYGAKPGIILHDGTIAPSAAAGSIPFTPEIAIPALKHMYTNYGEKLYGFYGFKDAFNLEEKWFSEKYIAINQGTTLLAIENYSTQLVWKYFHNTNAFKNWHNKCIDKEK